MKLSIRARLAIAFACALLAIVSAVALTEYAVMAVAARRAVDQSLNATFDDFLDRLRYEAHSSDLQSVAAASAHFHYRDRRVDVFAADGKLLRTVDDGDANRLGAVQLPLALLKRSALRPLHTSLSDPPRRVMIRALPVAHGTSYVAVSQLVEQQDLLLREVRDAMFIGLPLLVLFAAGGAWAMARASLRPTNAMAALAEKISADRLGGRIPISNAHDELGRLATVLNDLFGRLEVSFTQQRRFFADAAHELRTPMSIIRGEAEVALSRSDRPVEEYVEALRVISDEARALSLSVENLFLLARAGTGQLPLEMKSFFLDDLLHNVVKSFRTIAQGVTVSYEVGEELPVKADEALLRRAIVNLVENAARHTPSGGSVTLRVDRVANSYRISVRDSGSGVPVELREQIFQPFFRASQGGTGEPRRGAGLGLPIARWIAETHGGTLSLAESSSKGSTFVLSLPVAI
jgi:heavy metal sensor kinase